LNPRAGEQSDLMRLDLATHQSINLAADNPHLKRN
jgi:hypothetical protein